MTTALDRIVAATDFSSDANNAVRRAAMLASAQGAELELLHVVIRSALDAVREWVRTPPDVAERLVDDARRVLEQSAASLGTPASARLAVGGVLDEILSSCARASMLVVGAKGLSPVRDAILGTTAERLVGRCKQPILIVRRPPRDPYRNVLVGIDLQPGSEHALAAAARIAPGAKMSVVHAYDVPFEGALQRAGVSAIEIDQHRAAGFHKALGAIRALSTGAIGGPDLFLPIVDRGDPARLIIEHEESVGADLVVIGKRSRSALGEWVLGGTARHVLAHAGCDVLVLAL
jgi:nucleotide-binding universal stress UspA family protein